MTKKNLAVIIFLTLTLVFSLGLVLRITIFTGRATNSATEIATNNSYVFASPLQSKADGKEKLRITVFLLDSRGIGIPNQLVQLNLSTNLTTTATQPYTDDTGKAIFDISSTTVGNYEISAISGSNRIPQKVKIIFY